MNKNPKNFFNNNAKEYKNKYNSNNIFHKYFFQSRLDIITKNLTSPLCDILDIGSGTGNYYDYFILKNINFDNFYGTDISSNMLDISNIKSNNKYCGDVWESNFDYKSLDLILMIGVSSYMNKKIFKKNLNYIASNLSKNGTFIITVNNKNSLDLINRKLFKFLFGFMLPKKSILKNFTPFVYNQDYIINELKNFDNNFKLYKIEKHNFTIFPLNIIFPRLSIFLTKILMNLDFNFLYSDKILIFKKNG